MCVIVINDKPSENKLTRSDIEDMWACNNDGFGITYLDDFETIKSMQIENAIAYMLGSRPYVAHFRQATTGAVNLNNCHPKQINNRYEFFFNGVCSKFAGHKDGDTAGLAEMLKNVKPAYWRTVLDMVPGTLRS